MIQQQVIINATELKDGVLIHSKPQNHELYDLMWERMHQNQLLGIESWGTNRDKHLNELLGIKVSFNYCRVLDLCCGLGRMSAACLEKGAQHVVCADGSFNGPKYAYQKIMTLRSEYAHKITPLQIDTELIDDCFEEKSFEVVIHYWALQHMRDYKKTLTSMARLLCIRGIMAFNFFTTGTTPPVAYELRELFLKQPLQITADFVADMGNSKGFPKKFDITDVLLGTVPTKFTEKYQEILPQLKIITQKYSADVVRPRIHIEDFQTPYVHNFDHLEVCQFVESIGLKILAQKDGWITAIKYK